MTRDANAASAPSRGGPLGRAADALPREWRSASRLVPLGVSVVSAALVLGPALGRGVVLSYDMVWSPDRRLTPFATGSGTPAPRAVPSDAVAWLLGWLVTPAMAQKLILAAILVFASLGASALLRQIRPESGTLATSTAALAAVWNPFVSERLVVGQWTVLLGYAVLPWAVRSALRVLEGTGRRGALVLAVCVAGLGGVNTVAVAVTAMLAVLVAGIRTDPRRTFSSLILATAAAAGVSAVWVLPALGAGVSVDPIGVKAFSPAADTPLGVWGSLVSGGGFWNTASHPDQRGLLLIAVLAAVLSMVAIVLFVVDVRRARQWPVLVPVLGGALVVGLSALPVTRDLWTWLVTEIPGGGVLRDSQKFLASWVVALAVGAGLAVDRLRKMPAAAAGPAAAGVIGLTVLLSPQLLWGVGGRLDAEPIPNGYREAAAQLSAQPAGEVGLLPWQQYRRYDWNGDRVSLTLAPRVIDQRVLFDDSLRLRGGTVAGENPRAAAVSAQIDRGGSPVDALEAAGVRYIAAELGAGLQVDDGAVRAAGRVIVDDPHLLVVDLGRGTETGESPRWGSLGWALMMMTFVVSITGSLVAWKRRKLPGSLLRSRP